MTRAALCLNMIVRNEAANIERCLASVAPYVDAWVIADTGSTDGTPEKIRAFFASRGIPGELHRFPFENFEQARNRALELASASGLAFDYLLFVDADMELVVADPDFRDTLTEDHYLLRQRNQISYFNSRLLRRNVPARYRGVTHEYLDTTAPVARSEALWFIDHASGSNRAGKFERDVALLREALKNEPGNARYVFYLAQSLRDAQRLHDAREAYLRRSAMGGWEEEVWYSLFQVARIEEQKGDSTSQQISDAYLAAYRARPTRAEPLVELARWYRERGEWAFALLYARAACAVDVPADVLFLDDAAYAWRRWDELAIAAFYAGAIGEGRCAAERLLRERRFPESELPRIEANSAFYR